MAHSRDLGFAPLVFRSELMEEDLISIHNQFSIPPEFQLEILKSEERVCSLPDHIGVYVEYFRAGFRLLLHPFFIVLFYYLEMSFCSVVPNSWRHVCGFIVAYLLAGIEPTVTLFHYHFIVKRHPIAHGW